MLVQEMASEHETVLICCFGKFEACCFHSVLVDSVNKHNYMYIFVRQNVVHVFQHIEKASGQSAELIYYTVELASIYFSRICNQL